MMAARALAAATGVVFGFMLAWSGLSDPDVIRRALLLEDSYLFLLFAAGVATSALGVWALRRARARAVLTGEPIAWENPEPERRHVVGSVIFGAGWGVANVCPGPVASQLGQGVTWSVFTLAGLIVGVVLYLRLESRETAPGVLRGAPAAADG
jgi:uncharacterized membrane protein YedE/YeeE